MKLFYYERYFFFIYHKTTWKIKKLPKLCTYYKNVLFIKVLLLLLTVTYA